MAITELLRDAWGINDPSSVYFPCLDVAKELSASITPISLNTSRRHSIDYSESVDEIVDKRLSLLQLTLRDPETRKPFFADAEALATQYRGDMVMELLSWVELGVSQKKYTSYLQTCKAISIEIGGVVIYIDDMNFRQRIEVAKESRTESLYKVLIKKIVENAMTENLEEAFNRGDEFFLYYELNSYLVKQMCDAYLQGSLVPSPQSDLDIENEGS